MIASFERVVGLLQKDRFVRYSFTPEHFNLRKKYWNLTLLPDKVLRTTERQGR